MTGTCLSKKKKTGFGIIAIIAIIGFTMYACGDSGNEHTHTAGAAATCVTPQTCTGCGETMQAATGVHVGTIEPFAATCTDAGNSEKSGNCVYFAQCGQTVTGTVIAAIGTAHNFSEWEETTAPTCMTAGTDTEKCSICGTPGTETKTGRAAEPNNPAAHNFPAWTAPTCLVEGNSVRNCQRPNCNRTDTRTEGFAVTGIHTFTEWQETTPATCTDPAEDTEKCEVCGTLGTKKEAGHDPHGHSSGTLSGAIEPTCMQAGYSGGTGTCIHCGITLSEGSTIPKLDHHYHDWTAPTCTTNGNTERDCVNDCGTKDTRSTGYAALGHNHTSSLICKNDNCDHQYAIGDTGPAGGIIFYVAPTGFTVQGYTGGTGSFAEYTAYYLEASPANEGSYNQWGDHGTLIADVTTFDLTNYDLSNYISTDPKASLIGNGRKDTQIIVAHLATKTEVNRAAQLCASKSLNSFTDWFLPSLGELNEMYKAKGQTGIPTTGIYWSSSQCMDALAWNRDFGNVNQIPDRKDFNFNVRAVRAF